MADRKLFHLTASKTFHYLTQSLTCILSYSSVPNHMSFPRLALVSGPLCFFVSIMYSPSSNFMIKVFFFLTAHPVVSLGGSFSQSLSFATYGWIPASSTPMRCRILMIATPACISHICLSPLLVSCMLDVELQFRPALQ